MSTLLQSLIFQLYSVPALLLYNIDNKMYGTLNMLGVECKKIDNGHLKKKNSLCTWVHRNTESMGTPVASFYGGDSVTMLQ